MTEVTPIRRNQEPTPLNNGADILLTDRNRSENLMTMEELEEARQAEIEAAKKVVEKELTPPDDLEIARIASRLVHYNRGEELKEVA